MASARQLLRLEAHQGVDDVIGRAALVFAVRPANLRYLSIGPRIVLDELIQLLEGHPC